MFFLSWQWHSLFRRLGNNSIIHSITSLLIGCIVVHLNESSISVILIYFWCLIFFKKPAAGKILWPTRVQSVFFCWLYKQLNWVFILRVWTLVLFMTIIKFVKAEIKLQSICCWNVLFVWKQTWYKFWISRQFRSISPKVQTALESWAVPRSVHQVSSKVRGIETSQFAKKLPEHCNQSSFVVLVQSRWWLNHCST